MMLPASRSIGVRATSLARTRVTGRFQQQMRAAGKKTTDSTTLTPPATTEGGITSAGTTPGVFSKDEPDFSAITDYRTSNFSPVPINVHDGSEPGDALAAAVVSGAPMDLQARTVRIYRPAKPATQSGDWHSHAWLMDWDPLSKGHRWENPLMGWQSSADYMQGERVAFKSKEDAIAFAEKQGYEYFVQEPNARRFTPKAYANNFSHVPGKLKIIRTK